MTIHLQGKGAFPFTFDADGETADQFSGPFLEMFSTEAYHFTPE
jgi:hypothetical protein